MPSLTFSQYPWQLGLGLDSSEDLEVGVGACIAFAQEPPRALGQKLPKAHGPGYVFELPDEILKANLRPEEYGGHKLQAKKGRWEPTEGDAHFGAYLDRLLVFVAKLQVILGSEVHPHGALKRVPWETVWERLDKLDVSEQQENLFDRLAKAHCDALESIRARPRKILRRRDANLPVNKIRETDAGVIGKIARLPGRTLVEKAGDKRMLPAIERYETIDVLENRVVEHFCRLAKKLAERLEGEAESRGQSWDLNHKPSTRRFARVCREVQRHPLFSEISKLTTPCMQPTYALEQNKDYRSIWTGYQEILRHMSDRDSCWYWTRRSFLNWALVSLAEVLHKALAAVPGEQEPREIFKKHLRLGTAHHFGLWLDWTSLPGPKLISSGGTERTVALLSGPDLEVSGKLRGLWGLLNADAYIVSSQRGGTPRVCPVYALFGNRREDPPKGALARLEEDMPSLRGKVEAEVGLTLGKAVFLWPQFKRGTTIGDAGGQLEQVVPIGVYVGRKQASKKLKRQYAENLRQALLG